MHILVTGAGGFSGAVVTVELLRRGHQVTACIGSTRGRLPESAGQLGRLEVIAGDLAGDIGLPNTVDAIVHAAARLHGAGVTVDDIVRDNVVATQKLVRYAKQGGVRAFIYLSSLSIYGQIESSIVDESTPVLDPDVYGQSKRIGEELIAAELGITRSLAIRLPGIIGHGSVRNWLTNVLMAARDGREIVVFNPDALFNNAVHVTDLAEFVGDLLKQEWKGFDSITVGAAGQTTVREAVQLITDAFGGRSHIQTNPAPKRSFLISSTRARERYSYRPMEILAMLQRFSFENKKK